MKRFSHFIFCLTVACAAHAQPSPTPISPNFTGVPTNLVPPLPSAQPPVAFFRRLLAMTPAERLRALANRPAATRTRILAKVHEYLHLDPNERELRLRATELRWYLTPLMRAPADQREAQLAQVPDDLRGIVRQRLSEWAILPSPLQQELLANDQTLPYFAQVVTTNEANANAAHEQLADQFNQFFELTPAEKRKTLTILSPSERAQMENTLQSFEKLPPSQRFLCIRNYAKFAGMTVAERTEFLKNAEHWSQMTASERQAWRDLVNHVPQWPPMPNSNLMPPAPMPPMPGASSHSPLATN